MRIAAFSDFFDASRLTGSRWSLPAALFTVQFLLSRVSRHSCFRAACSCDFQQFFSSSPSDFSSGSISCSPPCHLRRCWRNQGTSGFLLHRLRSGSLHYSTNSMEHCRPHFPGWLIVHGLAWRTSLSDRSRLCCFVTSTLCKRQSSSQTLCRVRGASIGLPVLAVHLRRQSGTSQSAHSFAAVSIASRMRSISPSSSPSHFRLLAVRWLRLRPVQSPANS